jgi:predicted transcriptional regulator of viral defense system
LNGKTIFIAEIEKAILDSIFLPQYTSIHETCLALKEGEIKEERIIEYTKRMNSNALAKRLGYLLELNGIDIYSKIKDMIDKNYVKLNPLKARKGEKIKSGRF